MKADIVNFIIFGFIFLIVLVIVEFAYRKFSFPVEFSRKTIHVFGGTVASFFIFIFKYQITAITMAMLFLLIIWLSKKTGLLRSIHGIRRESIGVLIFPITICLIFILTRLTNMPEYAYFSSVMVLSISDPMASLGGYINWKFNNNSKWMISDKPFKTKTWLGSSFFFISSLIILLASFFTLTSYHASFILIMSPLISLFATIAELMSFKGWDNLTSPFAVWGCVFLIESGLI